MSNKYSLLMTDVFSIFAKQSWKDTGIFTVPSNIIPVDQGQKWIRVDVLPRGKGINLVSASGVLIVDIFTPAGDGPMTAALIADSLDDHLSGKSVVTLLDARTQFQGSSLSFDGIDKVDPSLYRSTFTIPFNYFGASQ